MTCDSFIWKNVHVIMEKELILISFLICVKPYAEQFTCVLSFILFKAFRNMPIVSSLQGRKLKTHKDY